MNWIQLPDELINLAAFDKIVISIFGSYSIIEAIRVTPEGPATRAELFEGSLEECRTELDRLMCQLNRMTPTGGYVPAKTYAVGQNK